jgi:outer membrane protein TolC
MRRNIIAVLITVTLIFSFIPAAPAESPAPSQGAAAAQGAKAPPTPETPPADMQQTPAVLHLDLTKSEELALANSPTLMKATAKIREYEGKIIEAQMGKRASLVFDANYTRIEPQVQFTFNEMLIQVVQQNNWDAKLTFNYLITDFGHIGRYEDAAYYNRDAVEREYEATKNDLIFNTRQAYFTVLKASGFVAVAGEFLESAKAHLKAANDRYKAGTVARFDVLRAEANVEEAMQQVVVAENNLDLAKKNLLDFIGVNLDTEVELAIPSEGILQELDLQGGNKSALSQRPELGQLMLLISMGRELVQAAKMERNAKISLFSIYDKKNATAFTSDYSWSVGVALNVPILDQGRKTAKTVQAVGTLDQMKATYEDMKKKILLEVNQAFLLHRESLASWEVTKKRVASSGEAKKVADIRYKAGISTNVEALDAEADFTRARAAEVNALFDCHIAAARWYRAIGAPVASKKNGRP